jgi:hypothetical protein
LTCVGCKTATGKLVPAVGASVQVSANGVDSVVYVEVGVKPASFEGYTGIVFVMGGTATGIPVVLPLTVPVEVHRE